MTTKITTTPTPLAVVDTINSIIDDTTNLSTTVENKLDKTGTAAKATADASGNNITDTYVTKSQAVTSLSASGKTVTYTKADGSTGTFTTQDTTSYHTGNATSIGSASATKPAVVITTYKSGKSWYRVWSDNWVEQGGYFAVNGGDQTITFPKAFKDTNYTLVDAYMSSSSGSSMQHREVAIATSRTATNFVAHTTSTSYGVGKWWYACGQGA